MTFTYDLATPTDRERVRWAVGDVSEETAIFSDEEIAFVLSEEGTVGGAILACINSVLARLSHEPDMTADWLRIDYRRSADYWLKLLAEIKVRYGLGWTMASAGLATWRPDSFQAEAPEYDEP